MSINISEKNLRRLTIALYMVSSALVGAIAQFVADNGWPF